MIATLVSIPWEGNAQVSSGGSSTLPREGLMMVDAGGGGFQVWLNIRVQLDAAWYVDTKNPFYNGSELRRGRLGLHPRYGAWDAELDIDVADSQLDVNNVYLQYTGDRLYVRLGQFKEPFGLERLTSSRYLTFMERALPGQPDALPAGGNARRMGVSATRYGGWFHAAAGVFGQNLEDAGGAGNEGVGLTGRGVVAPVRSENRVLHLGASFTVRTPDVTENSRDTVRFRARPESHLSPIRLLNTGRIEQVRRLTGVGLESALMLGPVRVQGEYLTTSVSRKAGRPGIRVGGGYAFASWMLTGERRTYSMADGEFFGAIPSHAAGAVEIALRYSVLDLTDFDALVLGGESEQVTVGVNWYANRHVRFMIDASYANNDRRADGGSPQGAFFGGDDFGIVQMRGEIHF